MAYLNPDGDYVEPTRVENYNGEPRFWINGLPECGTFTIDELRAAYDSNDNAIFSAVWSGRIAIDATQRFMRDAYGNRT